MSGDNNSGGWRPPSNPNYIPPPPKQRPSFSLAAVIADFLLPYGLAVLGYWRFSETFSGGTVALLAIAYVVLRLKQILLWAILIYQRFAPEKVRQACLFTPSCSEYMYLAIIKYGVLAGLGKGVDRLSRCRGARQGEDFP